MSQILANLDAIAEGGQKIHDLEIYDLRCLWLQWRGHKMQEDKAPLSMERFAESHGSQISEG